MEPNKATIEALIEKFLDGFTSQEEERVLSEFFRNGQIPAEWEPYREMFGWYEDSLQSELADFLNPSLEAEEIEKTIEPRLKSGSVHPPRRWWLAASAIAAAAAVMVLLFKPFNSHRPFDPYEGSYIIVNGEKIIDLNRIRGHIESTVSRVDDEQEFWDNYFMHIEWMEKETYDGSEWERAYLASIVNRFPENIREEVRNMINE